MVMVMVRELGEFFLVLDSLFGLENRVRLQESRNATNLIQGYSPYMCCWINRTFLLH